MRFIVAISSAAALVYGRSGGEVEPILTGTPEVEPTEVPGQLPQLKIPEGLTLPDPSEPLTVPDLVALDLLIDAILGVHAVLKNGDGPSPTTQAPTPSLSLDGYCAGVCANDANCVPDEPSRGSFCKDNGVCFGLYWKNDAHTETCYQPGDASCNDAVLQPVGCQPETPPSAEPSSPLPTIPSSIPSLPSDLPSGPSDIPTPPSDLPSGPSDIPTPPSDLPSGPSDIPTPPSDLPSGPSDIPTPPSDLPSGPSDIPSGPSDIPTGNPGDNFCAGVCANDANCVPDEPSRGSFCKENHVCFGLYWTNEAQTATCYQPGDASCNDAVLAPVTCLPPSPTEPTVPSVASEPSVPSDIPSGPPSDAPTAPSDAPTAPSDAPTAPSDAPTAPSDAPTAPTDAPTAPAEIASGPSEVPSDAPSTNPAADAACDNICSGTSACVADPHFRRSFCKPNNHCFGLYWTAGVNTATCYQPNDPGCDDLALQPVQCMP